MLNKEVRVQYFSVGKHTDQLVYWVFFMDQLMACKAVYTTHISPYKSEDKPINPGVAVFVFEQKAVLSVCKRVLVADKTETPDPSQQVIKNEDVQRPEEALVL